jgi:hypothetical protein
MLTHCALATFKRRAGFSIPARAMLTYWALATLKCRAGLSKALASRRGFL